MPPRSQDTICLTACPNHRAQYSWTISYSLLSHRGTWVTWRGEPVPEGKGKNCVNRTWMGEFGGSRKLAE